MFLPCIKNEVNNFFHIRNTDNLDINLCCFQSWRYSSGEFHVLFLGHTVEDQVTSTATAFVHKVYFFQQPGDRCEQISFHLILYLQLRFLYHFSTDLFYVCISGQNQYQFPYACSILLLSLKHSNYHFSTSASLFHIWINT